LQPGHALGATLLARLEGLPDLERLVRPYAAGFPHPRLTPAWALPDLPHPAALRVLRAEGGSIEALAVGPDASWLAMAGDDSTVRLWNLADGSPRAVLAGHRYWVTALVAGPDGSWLASAGHDRTVRVWSTADDSCRLVLEGHAGSVRALAV